MQELKKPVSEMFLSFLCIMALSIRELSLRTGWLMSQGSLKQLVPLLRMQLSLGYFAEAKPVLQKPFIMFCLDLFYYFTFLSTFQTALQTLEQFLFFALLSDFL